MALARAHGSALGKAAGPVTQPQDQAGQAGTEPMLPVPLWAVTLTAIKRPPPSHPCPGSPVLPAAQPCHTAKFKHLASHLLGGV